MCACFVNCLFNFHFCKVGSCPEDYAPFLGRCYAIFETGSNFSAAEMTCNAEGGVIPFRRGLRISGYFDDVSSLNLNLRTLIFR